MNKVQENKLSMYFYVEKVCNNHKNVWKNVKAFARAKDDFSDVIAKIQEVRQQQERKVKGVTKTRIQAKADLTQITMKYISALTIYALDSENIILLEDISITQTEMKRFRDSTLIDKCIFIYRKAGQFKEILVDYGMTEEDFNVFGQYLKTCKNQFAGTKEVISKRKISTQDLKDLFKTGDFILNGKLDNFIHIFGESEPEFYKNYKNLRKITHLGIKKAKEHKESTGPEVNTLQNELIAA